MGRVTNSIGRGGVIMLKMSKKFKNEVFDWLPSGEYLADSANATIKKSENEKKQYEPYLTPLSICEVKRYFIQQLRLYDSDDNNLEEVVNFLMYNPRVDYQKALATIEYYLEDKETVIEKIFAVLKYVQGYREWLEYSSYGSEYHDYFANYNEEDLLCLHTLGEIEHKKLVMNIADDIKSKKLLSNKDIIEYLTLD